jgi:hypothetical protein
MENTVQKRLSAFKVNPVNCADLFSLIQNFRNLAYGESPL